MPSTRTLQKYAIAVSIFSLFYNTGEGVVSILFGAENSSRALVFYGIQSAVEVISDLLVTWRFLSVNEPGNETDNASTTSPQIIRIERISTFTIGALLVALTFAAVGTSAASLSAHDHPSTTLPALLIAATSTGVSLALYLVKRYLARALNSSALNGEALCSLCCMQLSVVLLIGSLIYRVWSGGWWVDATTAMVIAAMFGWEGFKMVRWARNKDFDGGCCGTCHPKDEAVAPEAAAAADVEKSTVHEQGSCSCCTLCREGSKKDEVVKCEHV